MNRIVPGVDLRAAIESVYLKGEGPPWMAPFFQLSCSTNNRPEKWDLEMSQTKKDNR